ncbi:MAG: hypothetical protein ACKOA8_10940 [Deltaproteobacteria bacterium]
MKWELKEGAEIAAFEIDSMLYKVLVEELAEVLYKVFCQLESQSKSLLIPTDAL